MKKDRLDLQNEETIYFANNEDAKHIRKSIRNGRVENSTEIQQLYKIKRKLKDGRETVVGLGADYGEWNCEDGACGKLFQARMLQLNIDSCAVVKFVIFTCKS